MKSSNAPLTAPGPTAAPAPETRRCCGGRWRLISFVTFVCFTLLATTGFIPVIGGRALAGFPLLVHVGLGGVFAVALTLLVIAASALLSFDLPAAPGQPCGCNTRKVLFWLFAACGLSLIISAVLMMTPMYGTAGQRGLLMWHLYSAGVAVVVAILYAISSLKSAKRH